MDFKLIVYASRSSISMNLYEMQHMLDERMLL